MISFITKKIFGSRNERYIKSLKPIIAKINSYEEEMSALENEDIPGKMALYKAEVQEGHKSLNDVLPEVFALVRETSKRVLGMRHYDVQLVGGIALHEGKIAEMKTGEGKTLVATLSVVLNALSGKGVHVITVNDYLAQRDANWMGKLYNALGLSVGVIVHGLDDIQRKAAYDADITYGTNNEFGFDYLRDNMKFYATQLVQRKHNFAIVDEVDSILIDEARTPLIISGASEESTGLYRHANDLIKNLVKDTDFTIDEKARTALLTEEGVSKCEKLLNIENLFDPSVISLQHHILQALRGHYCYGKDIDYIVSDEGKVVIVDEFTGRLMPGRRFGDGLHQALEAKENVKIEAENQTLASITFQNYFRLYAKLAGMTGTADTEALEFSQIYKLEVISIPPNKKMVRKDLPDLIFRTQKEKFQAIVESIKELHQVGQPILVGTISIETSEFISQMLTKAKIPHNVLNAKHHAQEAEIISQAGQKGKVTIATNMAGRGTDIVLGEGVLDVGGLHILGTERHESRRIDNQLRGRSGRQGDPGSSRFFLSLEDTLMRIFGSDKLSSLMQKLGMKEGEPIENAMVTKAIENAQKRVEGHYFEMRKTLLEYDNVMNQQREVVYTLRHELMEQEDLEPVLQEFLNDFLEDVYDEENIDSLPPEEKSAKLSRLLDVTNISRTDTSITPESPLPTREEAEKLAKASLNVLREDAPEMFKDVVRYFFLEELDKAWKEHLRSMDYLREGIGLRGYGQRDPKLEYKKEGFQLFQDMLFRIRENAIRALTRVRIQKHDAPEQKESENPQVAPKPAPALKHKERPIQTSHSSTSTSSSQGISQSKASNAVGRNDPCPCGSGKKYKKCCGQ